MKKITEKTLNAIQENVRTRETQELDYKRDNLFKGSWKDFEIKDLKSNLIPKGWDSFEPYGSGKNYVENWDFEDDEIPINFQPYYWNMEVINNQLHMKRRRADNDLGLSILWAGLDINKNYLIRIKYKSKVEGKYWFGDANVTANSKIEKGDEFIINEVYFTPNKTDGRLIHSLETPFPEVNDLVILIDWIQITPVDNQHLVVEKTPIGNGLTRIQSWGGNSYIKLQAKLTLDSVGQYNISQYLDCNKSIFIGGNDGREFNEIVQNGFNVIQRNATNRNITLNVRTGVFDKELDFIASDMQVNMGDVPNPTMIVTPLSDGREHVQVYGATKDTKLVYSGDEGFIGEDYGLKTTIENNGIDLDLSTSLTEEKKRIEKGDNKVNLQGELSTKLSVEIGVPSE